jgi:hypothetical protein
MSLAAGKESEARAHERSEYAHASHRQRATGSQAWLASSAATRHSSSNGNPTRQRAQLRRIPHTRVPSIGLTRAAFSSPAHHRQRVTAVLQLGRTRSTTRRLDNTRTRTSTHMVSPPLPPCLCPLPLLPRGCSKGKTKKRCPPWLGRGANLALAERLRRRPTRTGSEGNRKERGRRACCCVPLLMCAQLRPAVVDSQSTLPPSLALVRAAAKHRARGLMESGLCACVAVQLPPSSLYATGGPSRSSQWPPPPAVRPCSAHRHRPFLCLNSNSHCCARSTLATHVCFSTRLRITAANAAATTADEHCG